MAIQRKIQLYVSDASGGQKTAKYYRIPLPADNLPFNKETNIYKNMMHFYCTISGDSATFGAIGFADSIISLYEGAATHKGHFSDDAALVNLRNITPTIPEKLLNDGELSFDVHGSLESIHYNSVDGYVHNGYSIFYNPTEEQVKYLEKIVKKSGIFQSSNVIRSNSENELSQFVPSTWQEFDTMEDLLADVRTRINDVKTMDRGELYSYEECIAETDSRFNPSIGMLINPLGTLNELKVIELNNLNLLSTQTVPTGCDGRQRILSLIGSVLGSDVDLVVDTTTLTDEIALVANSAFNGIINTITRIQPNTGDVKLNDKFGNYGTSIVFKNKADSANLVLKMVDGIKPIDALVELTKRESATSQEFRDILKEVSLNDLVPAGAAMPPRMNTTDVPVSDFIKIKNSENFLLLDVNKDNVTFKFTPGTKFRLFVKSPGYSGSEIDVDNSRGTFEANIIAYSDGVDAGAKLLLVKYDTTDITVSW